MELKTTLNEEMTKRYQAVKEHSGMNSDKEILNVLISREYSRIQRSKLHKVFLPRETYEMAEKAAEARNQTLYEYVEELALDMIKKAKEGEKDASSN